MMACEDGGAHPLHTTAASFPPLTPPAMAGKLKPGPTASKSTPNLPHPVTPNPRRECAARRCSIAVCYLAASGDFRP
ncbi:hypothetical protein GUJ93_ZPchr0012g22104 [Zizania palustris]|uniref:Uncharacterized protein n=1 Tax=Zizania palustris TaxID=103762 RepID=A0A8J5WP72_ZIZPA|nr:hypothetical protein GUJ93_ZPchr0012g22104 [Zizania palustris]